MYGWTVVVKYATKLDVIFGLWTRGLRRQDK